MWSRAGDLARTTDYMEGDFGVLETTRRLLFCCRLAPTTASILYDDALGGIMELAKRRERNGG
jgi:hypothetical protein